MVKAKKTAAKKTKKKDRVVLPHARVSIRSTFNNTIVAVTDMAGNVLTWSSGGKIGFKGSRKGTPFAAQLAAQDVAKQAKDLGVRSVEVEINGPGAGRESALRSLQAEGIDVKSIRDTTPIPHNGCRPPKRRRV
jgi:small subunit ribosomal protein S11